MSEGHENLNGTETATEEQLQNKAEYGFEADYKDDRVPVWETPGAPDSQTLVKKYDFKWIANAIGLALCLQLFFIFAVDQLVVMFLKAFADEQQINTFLHPAVQRLYGTLKSVFVMTVPFLFTTSLIKSRISSLITFKSTVRGRSFFVVMLGFGVCSVANMATSVFATIFERIFGSPVQSAPSTTGGGTIPFWMSLLCIGIIPAFVEEFAFRGVILGALRKRASDGMAIFVSSFLFALVHGNLQQIPFAFIVGLILAYSVVYTGSIIPAMVIHFLNNTCTVFLNYASASMSPQVNALIYWLYLLTLILVGLCGLVAILKTDGEAFRLSREKAEDTGNNMKWFFSSAFIVAFIVLICLETLSYQFG